jgi:hypothetical protein
MSGYPIHSFHAPSLWQRRKSTKQLLAQAPLLLGEKPDPRMAKWVVDWLNKHRESVDGQRMAELVSTLGRSLTLWGQIMDKGKRDERTLALTVMELWSFGSLRRVRLCEQCKQQWFAGEHKNYRFCGSRCRAASFRGTEQAKEKGRIRQRKYRENLKRKELNELKIR